MARVKITEEQYNIALKEGLMLKADVSGANGDIRQAVQNSKQQAVQNGVNLDNATIAIDANDVNESYTMTVGEWKRKMLREDKEKHSELMSISEFKKRYNIK